MSPHAGDIDRLLSKCSKFAGEVRDDQINELVDELNELKL